MPSTICRGHMDVAAAVTDRMQQTGVGVCELARAADVQRPHLSLWLSGKRGMSLERILQVCDAVGLKIRVSNR